MNFLSTGQMLSEEVGRVEVAADLLQLNSPLSNCILYPQGLGIEVPYLT